MFTLCLQVSVTWFNTCLHCVCRAVSHDLTHVYTCYIIKLSVHNPLNYCILGGLFLLSIVYSSFLKEPHTDMVSILYSISTRVASSKVGGGVRGESNHLPPPPQKKNNGIIFFQFGYNMKMLANPTYQTSLACAGIGLRVVYYCKSLN